jgi:hypothetical protein
VAGSIPIRSNKCTTYTVGCHCDPLRDGTDSTGPIVRINPFELHVRDPDFYDVLYCGSSQKRDKWFWFTRMFGQTTSAFATQSHDQHRLRRSALNPFFSKQAISHLEPMIRTLTEKLHTRLTALAGSSEPVHILKPYSALTTDVITQYCFGTSYGCLDSEDWAFGWYQAMHVGTTSAPLNKQFSWLYPLMMSIPEWVVAKLNPPVMYLINFTKVRTIQIRRITC